ncbi:MAG: hypothetical protein KGP28_05395 [Bdellovibrionales bacterium]|nr:hypothetical protein [Bdellovibrionales bacterium]
MILFTFWFGLPSGAASIVLPEDEVILPPLLNRVRSDLGAAPDGLNVRSPLGAMRRAVPGEWLDYGDSLSLPGSASFEVIQSEDLTWVGGGVFQGTVGNYRKTSSALTQYSLAISRGWIRVWIRPGRFESLIRIEGNSDVFTAKEAEFWLNFSSKATDLYVIRGEVTSQTANQVFSGGTYVKLRPGQKSPRARSEAWKAAAMEVPIASSYPGFIRLSNESAKDWEGGQTRDVYSSFRKKGWRKFHRLTPELKKRDELN